MFGRHVERFAASVMFCVAYGRRVDKLDDPIVTKIYERMGYMATLNVYASSLCSTNYTVS